MDIVAINKAYKYFLETLLSKFCIVYPEVELLGQGINLFPVT